MTSFCVIFFIVELVPLPALWIRARTSGVLSQ